MSIPVSPHAAQFGDRARTIIGQAGRPVMTTYRGFVSIETSRCGGQGLIKRRAPRRHRVRLVHWKKSPAALFRIGLRIRRPKAWLWPAALLPGAQVRQAAGPTA